MYKIPQSHLKAEFSTIELATLIVIFGIFTDGKCINEWGIFKQLYISNLFLSMSGNTKKYF
jgi:hypothetical protein